MTARIKLLVVSHTFEAKLFVDFSNDATMLLRYGLLPNRVFPVQPVRRTPLDEHVRHRVLQVVPCPGSAPVVNVPAGVLAAVIGPSGAE